MYSAYKGLRRRVRGDFSGRQDDQDASRADPHPSRAFDANETSTTNVDDAFAALDAAARKGRPPPGTLDPSNPVPAPVSRDVRVGTREFPGILSSGSEPASSESTASRAYREALRVMLPPDARARAAAREPTTGTTGTIAPGSASARSHPRVSPGFPRRSFDATSSAGHISGTATGTHHTKTSSRNVSRSDASPSPGTSSTKTSPSPSGEPARDAAGHPPRSRARRRDRSRGGGGGARGGHPAVDSARRRARSSAICAAEATPSPASLAARSRCSIPFSRWNPPPRRWDACRGAWIPRSGRASRRRLRNHLARLFASPRRIRGACRDRGWTRENLFGSERFRRRRNAGRATRDSAKTVERKTSPRKTSPRTSKTASPIDPRRAPRVHPGSPRVVVDDTRGARVTHVVLAVDVFVFFSGRPPAPRTWVSGRGGSVAGDHLARSPATMAAARARAAAMVKRTNRAGRSRFATRSDSESDGDDDEDDGSSSSDERFESRLFLRSLRPANGASDLENLRAVRREMLARRAEASPSTVVPVSSDVWTELAKLGGFESFDDVPTAAEAAAGLSASVSAVARAGGDVASATREVSRARVRAAYAADAARKRADAPTRPHAAAVGSGFGSRPGRWRGGGEEYREARAKQAGYGERR